MGIQFSFARSQSLASQVTAPAWLSSMTEKTWTTIAITGTINAVKNNLGVTNPANVMKPWGGGFIDTLRARVCVHGGGHTDCSDNWLYNLGLIAATPAWASYNPGSAAESVHSSANSCYCPLNDTYWQLGQFGIYSSGNNTGKIFKMPGDLSSGWTQTGTFEALAGLNGDNFDSGGCGYDSVNQKLIAVNQYGCIFSVNPTTGTPTTEYSNYFEGGTGPSGQHSVWVWPEARAVVAWAANNKIYAANLDSLSSGWTICTTSGLTAHPYAPGYCWYSKSKKLLWWNGDLTSRAYFHTLIPPNTAATSFSQVTIGTWTEGTVAPDASNSVIPSAPAASLSGDVTYGRFNVCSYGGIDFLVLINDSGTPDYGLEPTYVYRLPAAGV